MSVLKRFRKQSGVVLVLCMAFIVVFSSLRLFFVRMSVANAQIAENHHLSNVAMAGAFSAMELGKYAVAKTPTFSTGRNTISEAEAEAIWANLFLTLFSGDIGGLTVASSGTFSDGGGDGEEIVTDWSNYGGGGEELALRFYRYDSQPGTIRLSAVGRDGAGRICRTASLLAAGGENAVFFIISSRFLHVKGGRHWRLLL